jgi:hypothetical protein
MEKPIMKDEIKLKFKTLLNTINSLNILNIGGIEKFIHKAKNIQVEKNGIVAIKP